MPTSERILWAEEIVRSIPDPPQIEEMGDIAFYNPHEDLVRVPGLNAFETPEAFYATLFHELGHVRRLNRPGVSQKTHFGSDSYSREELVAELISAFCCAAIGLDNSLLEDSASHLSGWLTTLRADDKAFVTAAGLAQKSGRSSYACDNITGRALCEPFLHMGCRILHSQSSIEVEKQEAGHLGHFSNFSASVNSNRINRAINVRTAFA